MARLDICDEQHVRAVTIELEPLVHALAKNGRREWPERLPELDLEVHDRLHRRRARITDNRAAAESPWAEFHPPEKKPDDFLCGDESRDLLSQRRTRDAARLVAFRVEEFRNLLFAEAGPEIRSVHPVRVFPVGSALRRTNPAKAGSHRRSFPRACPFRTQPRLLQMPVPQRQRHTKRAAGIARRRLDPDLIERTIAKDPAVADTVERHAAGQAQIAQTRLAMRE